jgi:hypothetical protein
MGKSQLYNRGEHSKSRNGGISSRALHIRPNRELCPLSDGNDGRLDMATHIGDTTQRQRSRSSSGGISSRPNHSIPRRELAAALPPRPRRARRCRLGKRLALTGSYPGCAQPGEDRCHVNLEKQDRCHVNLDHPEDRCHVNLEEAAHSALLGHVKACLNLSSRTKTRN